MMEKTFKIKNRLGIHARPASLLAQTASKFASDITLFKEDKKTDCKSILGIMMLAVEYGASLKVVIDGPDEQEAMHAIGILIEKKI